MRGINLQLWRQGEGVSAKIQSVMSTFNSKQIDQILSENDAFLKAIQEFQSMGKVSEVIEYDFKGIIY